MSDSVVKYYHAWTEYFSSIIPSDTVFAVTAIAYAALFLALLAFKITSYDGDVVYASRGVLKYLKDKCRVKKGSLNFYMRAYPKKIYSRWECYSLEKSGKPSNYLTPDLAYSFGALESGFLTAYKLIVLLGTAINLLFALCKPEFTLVQALFLPIMTALIGIAFIAILEIVFTAYKRLADKKFRQAVKALDLYESHVLLPKKPISSPNLTSVLSENLDKIIGTKKENVQPTNSLNNNRSATLPAGQNITCD